jgi:hypothetical protein
LRHHITSLWSSGMPIKADFFLSFNVGHESRFIIAKRSRRHQNSACTVEEGIFLDNSYRCHFASRSFFHSSVVRSSSSFEIFYVSLNIRNKSSVATHSSLSCRGTTLSCFCYLVNIRAEIAVQWKGSP